MYSEEEGSDSMEEACDDKDLDNNSRVNQGSRLSKEEIKMLNNYIYLRQRTS